MKKRKMEEKRGMGRRKKEEEAHPWLHFSLLAAPAEESVQLHTESEHSGTRSG